MTPRDVRNVSSVQSPVWQVAGRGEVCGGGIVIESLSGQCDISNTYYRYQRQGLREQNIRALVNAALFEWLIFPPHLGSEIPKHHDNWLNIFLSVMKV